MYRNFGNQGRGNPPYPNRETGSPLTGPSNPASLANISTQTTQQEQVGLCRHRRTAGIEIRIAV